MQITKPIRRLANRIEILQSFSPHSIPGKSHQMPSRNRELSASSSPKVRRKRNQGGDGQKTALRVCRALSYQSRRISSGQRRTSWTKCRQKVRSGEILITSTKPQPQHYRTLYIYSDWASSDWLAIIYINTITTQRHCTCIIVLRCRSRSPVSRLPAPNSAKKTRQQSMSVSLPCMHINLLESC